MSDSFSNLIDVLKHLSEAYPTYFPGDGTTNYYFRFNTIAEYLNERVHPQVERSALLRDVQALKDGFLDEKAFAKIVYLTDHGPKHIETVIKRASQLVVALGCDLTPYEVYLLLVSIHFHDVGNLYGRTDHEKKIGQVMEDVGSRMGDDIAEIRLIKRIAAAHGGYVSNSNDKDTIRLLEEYEAVLGQTVRVQLLAALLRFADELADDQYRAARFLLEDQATLLYGSEIFHMYALHLDSVMVDPDKRIALHFWLSKADATKEFQKGSGLAFLIDEIFERTLKMHYEAVYCMRFIRAAPHPDSRVALQTFDRITPINIIKVNIEIFEDRLADTPVFKINYSLREVGYPQYKLTDIYGLCPEINESISRPGPDFQMLNGPTLKRILEEQE